MAEDTPNTPQENELQTPEALQALKEKLKAEVLNEAKAENRKGGLLVTMGALLGVGAGIAISFYWDTIGDWHNILLGTIVIAILLIGGLLYFILFFRSTILAKVFGVAKASYEDLFSTLYQPTKTLVQKNMPEATYEQKVDPYLGAIEKGARQLIAYQSFRRTRRFLFGLFISLVIGLGGIIGTIILLRQNQLLEVQNQLVEGQRRSSLIFMMSNVMDKVDEEIKVQKEEIRAKLKETKRIDQINDPKALLDSIQTIENTIDTLQWRLSSSLIGRIIALSHAFKPHQFLDTDSLSQPLSPERGQLLMALTKSNLDSSTYAKVYQGASFRYSDLHGADLVGANLKGVNLRNSDLENVNLSNADLTDADLTDADLTDADLSFTVLLSTNFSEADLKMANFFNANLSYASLIRTNLKDAVMASTNLRQVKFWQANLTGTDLRGANLKYAEDLSIEQLLKAFNLFGVRNLNDSLRIIIDNSKPQLFEYQKRSRS